MISIHTLRTLAATWWRSSLVLLVSGAVNAQEQLVLDFLKPEAAEVFFENDSENLRVMTTTNVLQVVGRCPATSTGMVVFNINGKESPRYLKDGEFTAQIHLAKGSNRISATLPTGFAETVRYEAILLESGSIAQIHLKSEGSEDEVKTPVLSESGKFETQTVNVPKISVSGKQIAFAGFEMKVKDSAGKAVIVESDGDQFTANYTLAKGLNTLTFQSTFEDKVFHEEQMGFVLEDVISISLDEEKNTPGFVAEGSSPNRFICMNSEIFLKGRVPAVTQGFIVLTINDDFQPIEVVDHEFEAPVPLIPNALTTVEASLETGGKTYSDFIEVQQSQPSIEIVSMNEGLLDGTTIKTGEASRSDENGHYFTESPILNITAKVDDLGGLAASIVNLATDEVFPVQPEDGQFTQTVYLGEGENTLKLRVGSEDHALNVDICYINLVSPVVFETVNDTPVESDVVNISGNQCSLYGIVNSISDGSLKLKVDDKEHTIPVVNGSFETEGPLSLSPGEHVVEALLNINQRVYKKSITIVAKEIPKENTSVGTTAASNDKTTIQEDQQSTVFTPPIPRRTPSPARVYDRVNDSAATGSVTLQFIIGKDGRVDSDSVVIVESTNEMLNREAKRSITRWRFTPAKDANGPIEKVTQVTLSWEE